MSFSESLQQAEKDYNIGKGEGKFKFQEGANKLRIMSESPALESEYEGKKNLKFITWVWDYRTNSLKLAFFPYTIAKAIAQLEQDPEYKFDTIPMPYDININAKDAGTKEVQYTVLPSRSESPVPREALDALAKEKSISEVRQTIIDKQKQPVADSGSEEEVKVADIPF